MTRSVDSVIDDSKHNLLDGSSLSHDFECLLNINSDDVLKSSTPIPPMSSSKGDRPWYVIIALNVLILVIYCKKQQ